MPTRIYVGACALSIFGSPSFSVQSFRYIWTIQYSPCLHDIFVNKAGLLWRYTVPVSTVFDDVPQKQKNERSTKYHTISKVVRDPPQCTFPTFSESSFTFVTTILQLRHIMIVTIFRYSNNFLTTTFASCHKACFKVLALTNFYSKYIKTVTNLLVSKFNRFKGRH